MPNLQPPTGVNFDNPSVLRILDAAEACFTQAGFAATSMREVAGRAEVSKALIHYHFDSKERLFLEMLGHLYRQVADEVQHVALDEVGPGAEAADRAFAALTRAMRRLAPLTPVLAEVGVAALGESSLRRRTEELLAETRDLVELAIRGIVGEANLGALPAPPAALAGLIHSALHGIALSALYDEHSLDQQLATFRALIFAALGATFAPAPDPRSTS